MAMLQKSKLEQQQFLIRQSLTRRLVGIEPARLMAGTQRIATQRQAMTHAQLDRERVGNAVDQVRNRLADKGTQDARRDLGRGVIDRHETGTHRRQLVRTARHFVRLDGQLGTPSAQLQRTAHHQARTRLKRAREIALIEPRQRNLARLVRQTRLQDAEATATGWPLGN